MNNSKEHNSPISEPVSPWEDSTLATNNEQVKDNFNNWFGDSQILNNEGDPAIVFHGSSAKHDFDSFDDSRQGQTAGVAGGFFFTDTHDTAMDVYGWRGQVIQVYLRITNPLTLEDYFERTSKDESEETEEGRLNPTNYFDEHSEEILNFAKANGYDGILFRDHTGDQYAAALYVVFDTKQIKSATANNGLYDVNSSSLSDQADLPTDGETLSTLERNNF